MRYDQALFEVEHEYRVAREVFGPMASPHEGISVLREEFEELWERVKAHKGGRRPMAHSGQAYREAIQVAAMAMAFLTDCCE